MKQTVDFYKFDRAFETAGRLDNFSYEGRKALFEYLAAYEEDTGEEYELDVIALCCEFTEYEDLEEFQGVYDRDTFPDLDTIRDHVILIEIKNSDGFIVSDI